MGRIVNLDIHNHLKTSSKFKGKDFNRAVDIASKRLGPGAILGMVNFADNRYEDLISLPGDEREDIGNAVYVPEKDVLIVKGQEVPTQQGHLLVIGLEKGKHLKGKRILTDTIKEAKDNNGIIIVDHPFYIDGIGKILLENPELLKDIDAIEMINGEAYFYFPPKLPARANQKAIRFCNNLRGEGHNIGNIVSSDGHSFYEIGRHYTRIIEPNRTTSETLTESLRKEIRDAPINGYHLSELFGVLGAIDHIADLVTIIGLSKFGIKKPFETRESYRIKE